MSWSRMLIGLVCAASLHAGPRADDGTVVRHLHAVEVTSAADRLVVALVGDGALEPSGVREGPDGAPRLTIELPDVVPRVPASTWVGRGPLANVRVEEVPGPVEGGPATRVVFDLRGRTRYDVVHSPEDPERVAVVFPLGGQPSVVPGTSPAAVTPVSRMIRPAGRRRGTAGSQAVSRQVTPAGGSEQGYTGEPVSMDFQDADLRAVLRTFAEISGLNLVIDPRVDGAVDVALTDVPWDQALDVILRTNQLGYQVDGTVLWVAPLTVLADEEAQRRRLAEEQALAGELVVLTRTLSYARAERMAQLVTQSVLSPRGQVQTDERTNTLIITDLEDRLAAAEELLSTLDRPEPQVEIEARIVQANRDFARSIGVRWGVTGRVAPDLGNTTPLAFPNRGSVTGRLGVQGPGEVDPRASDNEVAGTAVNLPAEVASSALGVTMGSVDGSLNLDVVIEAGEQEGELQLVSRPRVTTQNNVQAEIVQGTQIPIQTVANNTVTVQFQDAALSLRVTPQITAANTVIMQIEIDNDSPDFGRQINGIPPFSTQRAATTVQVGDGETTVIGGILENLTSQSNDRVPALHRIPLLGWLFKSRTEREVTDELLIFLTPRIIR